VDLRRIRRRPGNPIDNLLPMSKPKKFEFLIWHCTATREGRPVTRQHLEEWHLSPRNLPGGGVRYRGKDYGSRRDLPKDFLNGKPIADLNGRGWDRLGYSALFHINGKVEILQEWNQDEWIDPGEITYGASGFNSRARHFAYVGGTDLKTGEAKDTRTPEQLLAMEIFTYNQMDLNPDLQILGHNQVANKGCPSFRVPDWLRSLSIPEKNIYDKWG